ERRGEERRGEAESPSVRLCPHCTATSGSLCTHWIRGHTHTPTHTNTNTHTHTLNPDHTTPTPTPPPPHTHTPTHTHPTACPGVCHVSHHLTHADGGFSSEISHTTHTTCTPSILHHVSVCVSVCVCVCVCVCVQAAIHR